MNAEDALAELGIEVPWRRKISCPDHSDSDPSLHVYPEDRGWYCFSCNKGGDGWALLSHYTKESVGELMRKRGHTPGPRARSLWHQVDDLLHRAREATWAFHKEAKMLRGLAAVAEYAERVDVLFEDLHHKTLPEDVKPFALEQRVAELERFYAGALEDLRVLSSMQRETDQ